MSSRTEELLLLRARLLRAAGLGSVVVGLAAGCAPTELSADEPNTDPASAPLVDQKEPGPVAVPSEPAVAVEAPRVVQTIELPPRIDVAAVDGSRLRSFDIAYTRDVLADHVHRIDVLHAAGDIAFEVEFLAPVEGVTTSVAVADSFTDRSGDGQVRLYVPHDVDTDAFGSLRVTATFPAGERVTETVQVRFAAAATQHPTAPLLHPDFVDEDLIMGKAYRACAPMPAEGCADVDTFDDWDGRELASYALDRPLDPENMALGCALDFEVDSLGSQGDACCYVVSIGLGATDPMPTCVQQTNDDGGGGGGGGGWGWYDGRPFTTSDGAREATVVPVAFAPGATLVAPSDEALRQRVAEAWLATARAEHASIASFSRFQLELLALGAPADLLARSAQAIADELAHAELAFGVASALADTPVGPGALPIDGALARSADAEAVLVGAIVEGCVNETIASLAVRRAAAQVRDTDLASALARVADDEARHAELSWAFVRWLLAERPELAELARATFAEACAPRAVEALDDDASGAPWGVLSSAEEQAIAVDVIERVVRPCAEALLATC